MIFCCYKYWIVVVIGGLLTLEEWVSMVEGFVPSKRPEKKWSFQRPVYLDREADLLEQYVGGARYELSELPDSMMATTVFVGNLCEFVSDTDLSAHFARMSSLSTLPACVVRKPDMSSLRYGFVSFPSVKEKEAAIVRFHGTEFYGRPLKVEAIKDTPSGGRVRIPEHMIAYVSGDLKRKNFKAGSSGGSGTNLRSVTTTRNSPPSAPRHNNKKPSRHKGRLSEDEKAEFERAMRKGFVTLSKKQSSNRRLSRAFGKWCSRRHKPQICVHKSSASTASPLDQVVVDISCWASDKNDSPDRCRHHQDLWSVAQESGLRLCGPLPEDSSTAEDEEDLCGLAEDANCGQAANNPSEPITFSNIFVFKGERHQAKQMARQLALLWDIPDRAEPVQHDGESSRRRPNRRGTHRRLHRRRGGGHRQAWD